jgi:hypothetical protein
MLSLVFEFSDILEQLYSDRCQYDLIPHGSLAIRWRGIALDA